MFGKNPIRPLTRDPKNLAITEIFYTIQGEGPYSGMPALFIRLAGCNLACHFCDTEFELGVDLPEETESILRKIVTDFSLEQRKFVVITGGEPLRQPLSHLLTGLYSSGTELVQIETAGTLWQTGLVPFMERLVIVCSPKMPSVHPDLAQHCLHWKYIIRWGEVGEDGLPNKSTQVKSKYQPVYRPTPYGGTIWLSPCDEHDEKATRRNQDLARDLCLKHGYRLSLQIHKLIGVA